MNVKIELLQGGKMPTKGTDGAACFDCYARCDCSVTTNTMIIPLGFKIEIPDGYHAKIFPRSSTGLKTNIRMANSVGIIDADYYNNPSNEGHIWVKITYPKSEINNEPFVVKKGDAIFQGIIQRYFTVRDDKADAERVGGFGSTSK